VKESVRQGLIFLFFLALLIGGVKLYKLRASVTLDAGDKSMSAADLPPGRYRIDPIVQSLDGFATGDVVAFRVPGEPTQERVARVVAVEGDAVESDGKSGVLVNGKGLTFQTEARRVIPAIRVPRGHLYVLCDNMAETPDSFNFGPLPIQNLMGKVIR
jgi:signal peptidase I